jgi:hypothetical protein
MAGLARPARRGHIVGGIRNTGLKRAIMITLKNVLAVLILGLAVTTSASCGFAQESGLHMSAARAAAIQECSTRASKYLELAWGIVEIQVYRTCMAEHHQME